MPYNIGHSALCVLTVRPNSQDPSASALAGAYAQVYIITCTYTKLKEFSWPPTHSIILPKFSFFHHCWIFLKTKTCMFTNGTFFSHNFNFRNEITSLIGTYLEDPIFGRSQILYLKRRHLCDIRTLPSVPFSILIMASFIVHYILPAAFLCAKKT